MQLRWGEDSLNGIAARAVGIGAKAIGQDGIGKCHWRGLYWCKQILLVD